MQASSLTRIASDLRSIAFDALPCGVLCIDRQSLTVVDANEVACSMLGYSADELLDATFRMLCCGDEPSRLANRLASEGAGCPSASPIHMWLRRKDGHQVAVTCRITVVEYLEADTWVIVLRELSTSPTVAEFDDGVGRVGYDPLTSLPDRRLFEHHLAEAIRRAGDDGNYKFGVCFIDIDNFKVINDDLGHLVGDRVLCEIAGRLARCVRSGDTVARFGGDEFTVLIDGLQSANDAGRAARRMLVHVQKPVVVEGRAIQVAVSIGVALSRHKQGNLDALLHEADRAMYRAKAQGGNRFALTIDERKTVRIKPK